MLGKITKNKNTKIDSVSWVFLGVSSWGHPKQMPELPQLAPLNMEEQRLYSELLPGDRALRERPATLRRKLISETCIRDHILSVMTQSSWP